MAAACMVHAGEGLPLVSVDVISLHTVQRTDTTDKCMFVSGKPANNINIFFSVLPWPSFSGHVCQGKIQAIRTEGF